MFFKRSRRTLRSALILGTIQLLAVGTLSYIGYRYVRTSLQKHIPKQLDNVANSYQEIVGEPLPEEAQSTIKTINDFFKPSPKDSASFDFSGPIERESVSTIPSHPFKADSEQVSEFPKKDAATQSWVNTLEIASVVITDSKNNRASINGKTYRQGEIISRLYRLKWIKSEHTPNRAIRLYFVTPEGEIYIKDF